MDKQILVAVDDSPPSDQAVRYIADLSQTVRHLHCRLVHIQPDIPRFLMTEARKDPESQQDLEQLQAAHAEASRSLLARQRRTLADRGFAEARIATASLPRQEGLAKTLLDDAQKHKAAAIVAGRRDLSILQKPFMGRVTADLVENSTFLPIWIVDGEVRSTRLMVAVDGSESSLRVIDHLSGIFAGCQDVKFHLLHAIPRLVESCGIDFGGGRNRLEMLGKRGAHHCIDHFYDKALTKFKNAGIRSHQIETQILDNMLHPGRAIMQAAADGKFGTLVIGRRGINRSFFTGSVSRYAINRAENMALWLIT